MKRPTLTQRWRVARAVLRGQPVIFNVTFPHGLSLSAEKNRNSLVAFCTFHGPLDVRSQP